ncbi:CLUMA_CG001912, isoform A [Clunio marinus]|uniref:CLUMA_CG001912, isoform A n=1 Tax=Clunio marinus TaxID=568069 RepID=A0A1J1HJC3_9DIPT|nr:CLUMA_CG001912, isoform A [Clunio marinus]
MENNDPYAELEIYLKQINNEISEVFDKLHHVNESEIPCKVSDMVDNIESPQPKPIVKDKPNLRKLADVVKSKRSDISEWNSLAQFEKLVKLEMENLAAAKNYQQTNGTTTPVSMQWNNNNILKPEKHVTIPLQSFANKAKCITNINNCLKPSIQIKSSSPKSDECIKSISQAVTPGTISAATTTTAITKSTTTKTTSTTTTNAKVKDGWSSDDSILKSIDEDNKSTSSTVSSSSAFEDSTNMYSEKSESSMSSINILSNKVNENGKVDTKKTVDDNRTNDEDDSLEVLSSYDNDSGNDEVDEKGDRFNSFSYSSSDSRCDKKRRNYFNSLPLMRAKKHNANSSFNSMKRKHLNNSAIDQEPFREDLKAINLPSPSPSCGSWSSDSNMLQQNLSCTKSSSVPILVKKDQFLEDFNKLTLKWFFNRLSRVGRLGKTMKNMFATIHISTIVNNPTIKFPVQRQNDTSRVEVACPFIN